MGWVNTTYRFDDRACNFILPARDLHPAVGIVLSTLEKEPDRLEAALRELVVKERPGLAGCVIHCMWFDHNMQAWAVTVSHESLSPRTPGCEIERRYLLPRAGEERL